MFYEEPVDFTKARKGSRVNGKKIAVCPKCGRKGGDSGNMIVHKGVINMVGGITMLSVTEYCMIPKEK